MAYASNTVNVVGSFRHKETNVYFDYVSNPAWVLPDAPYGIVMCDGTTRTAKILKTVAYVAVDEDAYGNPVWEKWAIKNHYLRK